MNNGVPFLVTTMKQNADRYTKSPIINDYKGLMCLGRESNPYGHCCPRDFKSRVSTYSTTKANRMQR